MKKEMFSNCCGVEIPEITEIIDGFCRCPQCKEMCSVLKGRPLSTAKYVYVQSTNSIGIVLDKGGDEMGDWYRTDCDGVRSSDELLFLNTKNDVIQCAKECNANIAPSTRKLIGFRIPYKVK